MQYSDRRPAERSVVTRTRNRGGWPVPRARASVVAAIGCTLGVVPHMVAAITGLAALLNTSAVAFQTLKYAGVAYLLYLWQTWRDPTPLEVDRRRRRSRCGK